MASCPTDPSARPRRQVDELTSFPPITQSPPVLITGATGFIGGHICRALRTAEIPFRIFARRRSLERATALQADEVVYGELSDTSAIRESVTGIRALIYAAGTVRGRTGADFKLANEDGVAAFGAAMSEQTRTCSGPGAPMLLVSSLAATHPTLSHYAASKANGERALIDCGGLDWTILRPPAVYGPGDTEMRGLLAAARRGIVLRPGPSRQRVSLLHAADLAAALCAWLSAPARCAGEIYNIDDGYQHAGQPGYAWSDIRRILAPHGWVIPVPGLVLSAAAHTNDFCAGLFGYAPMLTPGKVRELQHESWVCDNTPLQQATGWAPRITLARGVADTFAAGH